MGLWFAADEIHVPWCSRRHPSVSTQVAQEGCVVERSTAGTSLSKNLRQRNRYRMCVRKDGSTRHSSCASLIMLCRLGRLPLWWMSGLRCSEHQYGVLLCQAHSRADTSVAWEVACCHAGVVLVGLDFLGILVTGLCSAWASCTCGLEQGK